jgi:hypothetical protein
MSRFREGSVAKNRPSRTTEPQHVLCTSAESDQNDRGQSSDFPEVKGRLHNTVPWLIRLEPLMVFVLYHSESDSIHNPEEAQLRSILMTNVLYVMEVSLHSVNEGPKRAS